MAFNLPTMRAIAVHPPAKRAKALVGLAAVYCIRHDVANVHRIARIIPPAKMSKFFDLVVATLSTFERLDEEIITDAVAFAFGECDIATMRKDDEADARRAA